MMAGGVGTSPTEQLDPVTMSSTMSPHSTATTRPVDAVVFALNALVDPVSPTPDTPPRAVPGVRRLVEALRASGLAPYAMALRQQDRGREQHLAETADHLAAAGLPPEVLPVVDADATVARVSRSRTLVVTRCPEMAAGLTAAGHPVAIAGDERVPTVVHRWLADRMGAYGAAAVLVGPLATDAADAVASLQLRLTKPPGSLGRLEALGGHLAAVAGECPPPLPRPATAAVFAGDHGVHAQGVSPWPQEVTAQMVGNFLAGGAAVNVLAAQAGADVVVVDVGVATEIPGGQANGHPDGAPTPCCGGPSGGAPATSPPDPP